MHGCLRSCLPLYCIQLFSLRALAAFPNGPAGEQRKALPCSADPQSSVSLSLSLRLSFSLSDSVSLSLTQFLPLWCILSHLSKKESFPLPTPVLFPPPPGGNLFPFFFLANSLSLLRVPIFKILSMVLQNLGFGRK